MTEKAAVSREVNKIVLLDVLTCKFTFSRRIVAFKYNAADHYFVLVITCGHIIHSETYKQRRKCVSTRIIMCVHVNVSKRDIFGI